MLQPGVTKMDGSLSWSSVPVEHATNESNGVCVAFNKANLLKLRWWCGWFGDASCARFL